MTNTVDRHSHHHAHVVVHPLVHDSAPYRSVDILGIPAGHARSFADLTDIVRRAGLPDLDLRAAGSVDWKGGGADQWG